MRPGVLVMAIAIVAALVTALLAKTWVDRQMVKPVAVQSQAMLEVLVVARDVTSGSVLQSDDLKYEKWPQTSLTPRLIVRQAGSDPKAQYLGQIARRPLSEGEPLSQEALFRADASGVLAGMLSPGMRAVSISITNPSAVSGFITPGDKVDIVLAADFQNTAERDKKAVSSVIQRYAAETILTDIKVLAIDQQIARGHDGAAIQGKTATVEVTPKQAEVLTAAGLLGNLQLVLRGLPNDKEQADPVPPSTPGFTSDTEASKALKGFLGDRETPAAKKSGGVLIHVNRAGHISAEGEPK